MDFVENGWLDDARSHQGRHPSPKEWQRLFCPLASSDRQAVGEYYGVDGTGARRSNAVKGQVLFFEEAIEHAPSEGAMAAPALKGQVERFLLGNRLLELARLGMRAHRAPPFRHTRVRHRLQFGSEHGPD